MAIYKKKNGKSWFCKFNYKDIKGITHQKKKEGFKTKKLALEYQKNFLHEIANKPIIYFKDLLQFFLDDKKSTVKPLTYIKLECTVRKHIAPYFSNYLITEITPAIVRKWQTHIIQEQFSNSYTAIICNALSSIFNFGIRYYNLSCNPAKIAGSIGSLKPIHTNFFTLDEYKLFSSVLDKDFLVIFDLLYYSGIRIGELLALTQSDIDFLAGTVSISKTYYKINNSEYVGTPKTLSSKRLITLPTFLLKELSHVYVSSSNQRIFSYTNARELNAISKRTSQKFHLPILRLHDFRHSHASYLINQGFSAIAVRDRLGHSSVKTTLDRYSHLYQDERTKIADTLENQHNINPLYPATDNH
jgi:integrase